MENTTNYNLKKPEYEDNADIKDINDNMDTIDEELYAKLMTPSESFAIPAGGATVYKNMTGLTSDHVLLAWQFGSASSSENSPPCNLKWTTYNGYFGIENLSSWNPNDTIKPVFGLPASATISAHT